MGIVLILVFVLYRLRVKRIEAELTTLFQKRLLDRARLAIDLNDFLLQTIEASKLIADDTLESSLDPDHTRAAMERLSYWLGNATQEGQAALNSLRTASCDGNDLASGFQRAIEECRSQRPIEFALSVTGKNRDMHPMVRDEVYRLGYEVISNFCMRPGADRLEVAMAYGPNFRLLIRASGDSTALLLAEQDADGSFDLSGMQARAMRFGAVVRVNNVSSSTVEFTLAVPGGIIFQNASSILPSWFSDFWHRLRSGKSK